VKAYHQVLGEGAFERVLESGIIIPAVMRVDPTGVETKCMDWVDEWDRETKDPDVAVLQAMREMLSDATQDMRHAQAEAGVTVKTRKTNLFCIDILFGDIWNIFLSPFEFALEGDQTGFVFDAEELVARGASVRLLDFMQKYGPVVDTVLRRKQGQHIEDPRERLMAVLEEAVGSLERTGDEALEVMRTAEKEGIKGWYDMEFIWKEGALPIDWAIEVWEKGKLITR